MKYLNPEEMYTIREISAITGIEYSQFYSYKQFDFETCILPSGRSGYALPFKSFEDILENCKTFPFEIAEYERYREKKRPIIRQFLDARETHLLMGAVGDPLSIFSVKRHLREAKMPAYVIERKYIVPIVYLVKKYLLPIDDQLDKLIEEIINEPYEFKL